MCVLGRSLGLRLQNVGPCVDCMAGIKRCQGVELDQETGEYSRPIPGVTDPAVQCEEFGETGWLRAVEAGTGPTPEEVGDSPPRITSGMSKTKLNIKEFVHVNMPAAMFDNPPEMIWTKTLLAVGRKFVLIKEDLTRDTRMDIQNALLHHPKAKNSLIEFLMSLL